MERAQEEFYAASEENSKGSSELGLRSFYQVRGKRWFDLCLGLVLLVLVFFVMLAVWLAILLRDGGPAIYRQCRIGRNGQRFEILKFRTMRPGSDRADTVTVAGDGRITPIGAVLRRTRLDELPQLWNVVRGDMSFVGPRPDVSGYADRLIGPERNILELRPGITGPAALYFANEADLLAKTDDPITFNDQVIWPEKVRINLDYASKLSLMGDLFYLWKTARIAILGTENEAAEDLKQSERRPLEG